MKMKPRMQQVRNQSCRDHRETQHTKRKQEAGWRVKPRKRRLLKAARNRYALPGHDRCRCGRYDVVGIDNAVFLQTDSRREVVVTSSAVATTRKWLLLPQEQKNEKEPRRGANGAKPDAAQQKQRPPGGSQAENKPLEMVWSDHLERDIAALREEEGKRIRLRRRHFRRTSLSLALNCSASSCCGEIDA